MVCSMMKTELALRTHSTKLKCPSETLSNMISLDIKRSYDTRLCHKFIQRPLPLVAFVVCVQNSTNERAALINCTVSIFSRNSVRNSERERAIVCDSDIDVSVCVCVCSCQFPMMYSMCYGKSIFSMRLYLNLASAPSRHR